MNAAFAVKIAANTGLKLESVKIMSFRIIGFLLVSMISAVIATGASAQTLAIGKVTRLEGSATETLQSGPVAIEAGSYVHQDADLATGDAARIEIVFIDGSQLTLGENARIKLDSLVFNAAARQSGGIKQSFELISGTFQFLSGAIGRTDRDAVTISTPVATIGIRGTRFFGGPLAAGMPPGEIHYGFAIFDGAIEVITPQGTVTLDDPNEGTFLPMAGGKAPLPPEIWDQEALDEAAASLAFTGQ